MEVYKHPMSVRYIPQIFVSVVLFAITLIATPVLADHLPVMYVQVPQWADDWAVCAVDIPCLLYTSPSPRDLSTSRMPSSA